MNEQKLMSNLQSRISTTSNRIFTAELWLECYKHLGRRQAATEVKDELVKLRQEQYTNKRLYGLLLDQNRYIHSMYDFGEY